MLVNMNEILYPAQKGRYGIGLFNAVNLELARGIIKAAEEKNSPVIIGTAEVLLPYGPLEEVSYFLIPMAKKARVPVVVHLDHGLKKDTCIKALELGFTSIMYDCSTEPYERNIEKVKEMADIAHSFGATIEGELGHVGDNPESAEGNSHILDPSAYYTDPKQAKDFVERTGVDALAIAVGTAHGAYKFPPQLDFQRIADMYNATCVSFPRLTRLSEKRKRAIKARLRKYSIDDIKRGFELAEESDFLKGENNRNWSATFDWMMNDANMAKILDGNYKNKDAKQSKPPVSRNLNNFERRRYDMEALRDALTEN